MNIKINEYDLTINRISNYSLYAKIISNPEFIALEEPKVPEVWSEKRKAYISNPFSPDYARDLEIYEISRNKLIIDLLLNECVEIDLNQIETRQLNRLQRTQINNSIKLAVLKYIVFRSAADINELIKNLLLTEALVYDYLQLVAVTRNGINLLEHSLIHPVNTTIAISPIIIGAYELVNPLHEYTACISSAMSWESWLTNKYTLEIMAYTVAMYRLNKLIEVHSQDEQQGKK